MKRILLLLVAMVFAVACSKEKNIPEEKSSDRPRTETNNSSTEGEHDYSISEDKLTIKDSFGENVVYKRKK